MNWTRRLKLQVLLLGNALKIDISHVELNTYKNFLELNMGSFSIWHWIVVLMLFSPLIAGLVFMGAQKSISLKHSQSHIVKNGYVGYCWPYFFLGWIIPIFRGEIGIGALHLILTLITFGLFQIIMPFLYNKQFMTRHLTNGYVLDGSFEAVDYAKNKLNIVD